MQAPPLSHPPGYGPLNRSRMTLTHWRAPPVLALLLSMAAVVAGFALATHAPPVTREPDLIPLLRFMALVKGSMVSVALVLVAWRARWPMRTGTMTAYVLACSVAALTVTLIAQLAWVGPAAIAFHAAELGFLLTALRDERTLRAPTTQPNSSGR